MRYDKLSFCTHKYKYLHIIKSLYGDNEDNLAIYMRHA